MKVLYHILSFLVFVAAIWLCTFIMAVLMSWMLSVNMNGEPVSIWDYQHLIIVGLILWYMGKSLFGLHQLLYRTSDAYLKLKLKYK